MRNFLSKIQMMIMSYINGYHKKLELSKYMRMEVDFIALMMGLREKVHQSYKRHQRDLDQHQVRIMIMRRRMM